jgi:hypothetical protein
VSEPEQGSATFDDVARQKLSRVLGPARGATLMGEVLAEIGVAALATPDDLMRFARALSRRGAFEGAVGAMLGVQAAMAGGRD